MAFRKRPRIPLIERIKINNTLVAASMDMVAFVRRSRLDSASRSRVLSGNGPVNRSGCSPQILGHQHGRDVSENSTKSGRQPQASFAPNHWPRAVWIFHRDAMKQIALLKDGNGRYLLQDSIAADEPDRIGGIPVLVSEYAPNTFTTGLYAGIIGDFTAGYWIVEAMTYAVQRLSELYAETNQTGLIARAEIDGSPVLEEAFVRVKLA
jgi:hypothetical protein